MTAPFFPLPYREGYLIFFRKRLHLPPGPEIEPSPPSDPFIFASRRDPELSPPPIRGRVASPQTNLPFALPSVWLQSHLGAQLIFKKRYFSPPL